VADDNSDPEPAEGAEEQAERAETEQAEGADEGPSEGAEEPATDEGDDEQPEIAAEEQASIPSNIDAEAIEDDTAEEAKEPDDSEDVEDDSSEEPASMEPETAASPVQAGELYVTLVHQTTNAAIRAKGNEESEEVDRDHFEDFDLAHYFDLTMEEMGVGSDLDPHEALVVATAMSMGQPILEETDVMDEQIGRLMDKATEAA